MNGLLHTIVDSGPWEVFALADVSWMLSDYPGLAGPSVNQTRLAHFKSSNFTAASLFSLNLFALWLHLQNANCLLFNLPSCYAFL
jgi:hypothetical protein